MRLEFITTQLSAPNLLKDLATVVEDPQSLIPQSEEEFSQLCKFGLYPADRSALQHDSYGLGRGT